MPENSNKDFEKVCKLAMKLGKDRDYSQDDIREIKELANKLGGIGVRMEDMNNDGVDELVLEKFSGKFEAKYFKIEKNGSTENPVSEWIHQESISSTEVSFYGNAPELSADEKSTESQKFKGNRKNHNYPKF